jgi:hypothetical protein
MELVRLLPDWKNAQRSNIFAENFFLDYNLDSLRKESISIFAKAMSEKNRTSPPKCFLVSFV